MLLQPPLKAPITDRVSRYQYGPRIQAGSLAGIRIRMNRRPVCCIARPHDMLSALSPGEVQAA